MKPNYILILLMLSLAISCGESQQEVEQEKAEIELQQKELAAKKERERIHLEKIEVGESLRKTTLLDEVERYKRMLQEEEQKLQKINEFEFFRTSAEKEEQLRLQNQKIRVLRDYITRYKNEIAYTSLRETFDFQDTPEGVVKHIFESAKNYDFTKFRHICDPYDGTIGISFIGIMSTEVQTQFVNDYKNGRIIGGSKIEGDLAKVEVAVGAWGNRLEKIDLVKRMDKWYIKDF